MVVTIVKTWLILLKIFNPEAKIIQTEANNLPFNNQITEYSITYSIFHYLPSYQYAINCIYELIELQKTKEEY